MSMRASEVIVTYRVLEQSLLVKVWYMGICIFFFKRKESEQPFRNMFPSG